MGIVLDLLYFLSEFRHAGKPPQASGGPQARFAWFCGGDIAGGASIDDCLAAAFLCRISSPYDGPHR